MNRSFLSLAMLSAFSLAGAASAQNSTPPAGAPPATSTATTTSASTSTTTSSTPVGATTSTSSGTTTTTSAKSTTKTEEKKNYALTLENACHSECIVLADYLGYSKGDWHWNDPPKTQWHITKILKGPPLNKDLPLRFEFHDHSDSVPPPSGWKFGPEKMPKKGDHFILFIEHAVPKNGMFDTYQGNYGRYEANEENLNSVYEELTKHNQLEERQR